MTSDGRAIANFVLDYFDQRGKAITHVALQKLVYFCHVWVLVQLGKPLIEDSFEAWEFGPVLPYLYQEFKESGREPIRSRAECLNPRTGERMTATYSLDEDVESFLEGILEIYGHFSISELIEMSHVAGGPWDIVQNHVGKVNPGMKIEDTDIQKYYSSMKMPISMQ